MNKIELIAKTAHEVNRAYCEAIGDDSQESWEKAPQWQKDSAIYGVEAIINNPHMTPEDAHNSWLQAKEQSGWKYGKVKDPDKKEHPCCVPYFMLPIEQKAKDYIYRAVVVNMLNVFSEASK